MRIASIAGLVIACATACGDATPPPITTPPRASATSATSATSAPNAPPAPRAPVVVAMVVDQLSAWVAATRWPALPESGGFARIRREGTWVEKMRLPYAVTDTAPGHASLHTGKVPAEHGIVGNELPGLAHRVTILQDDTTRVVTADGIMDVPGSSGARLRADTVADRLRAARPDALVVSVSVKDRGAILPAGKKPTHALWYDSSRDQFVTSTAFARSFPRWAAPIANAGAVARARAVPWTATDPAWLAAHAATPDDAPGEGDLDGMGTTFPHLGKSGNAFRGLPAGDRMILDLGLAAIAAEYDPKTPTLLLLSMSASDVVGHTFGPDSWEAWDQLMKLDRALGDFLAALEARVGPVAFILAADHGNVSMPEAKAARDAIPGCTKESAHSASDPWDRPCVPGVRIGPRAIGDELKAASAKIFPGEDLVDGVADPYVYLTPKGRALPPDKRARLDGAIRGVFAKHKDAIAEVYDDKTLAAQCPGALAKARGVPDRARPGEDVLTLVCRAWAPGLGGDYYAVVTYGSFWDGEIVAGKGTSHGGPYLYDRTVPMLVRAPGVDRGVVIDDPVDFSAYSALYASLLGLDARSPKEILASLTAR
jgi:hypothetical protein